MPGLTHNLAYQSGNTPFFAAVNARTSFKLTSDISNSILPQDFYHIEKGLKRAEPPKAAHKTMNTLNNEQMDTVLSAVEQKPIFRNPSGGCKLPPARPKEMKMLTLEEIQRLLIQAREDDYCELLLPELSTGLRQGEICTLQWDDLDLKTGALREGRQVYRIQGNWWCHCQRRKPLTAVLSSLPCLARRQKYARKVYAKTQGE